MSMPDTGGLTVDFREGVSEKAPIIPRRYTLTRADNSSDMHLTIAPEFELEPGAENKDVIQGEWLLDKGLRFYVYVHAEGGRESEDSRYSHLTQILPAALWAIRSGDRQFFGRPEMNQYPIIVYFLYENPEYNRAENWGTFADYRKKAAEDYVAANSMMEYHVLLDEKTGDVNGDGIPDKVSVYGDKEAGSDFIHNVILKVDFGQSELGADAITELNGYNPTVFLGDFTKDHTDDILLRMDLMFNSMNSKDKGEYGIGIFTMTNENPLEPIFASDNYNMDYRFLVEYHDFFKISVLNVKTNRLFYLDISDKGTVYLSRYYNEKGELIRPVLGKVMKAEAFLPIISNEKDNSYDLLALHRIVGDEEDDFLGTLSNLLSWNGEQLASIRMTACTPGTDLIPQNQS